jgi:LAS superfamily LD-carboxypeptidase LdcB
MRIFLKNYLILAWAFCLACANPPQVSAKLDVEKLGDKDIVLVDAILTKKAPLIREKEADGTLPLLTFKELYGDLDKKEKKFLKKILRLKPEDLGVKTPLQGFSPENPDVVKVPVQTLEINGKKTTLAAQYSGRRAYKAFERMAEAMERDLGKRLFIESGFRSSAYQLYSFVLYLREHKYSLRETATLNALPGYSEHGNPKNQALDFINAKGINGDGNPKAFTALPEYQWLKEHAYAYGFVLSYPRNNPLGLSFEPWHWKYISPPQKSDDAK